MGKYGRQIIKKQIVYLLTGAVLLKTVAGTTPPGQVATVVIEKSDTFKEVAVEAVTSVWNNIKSRWRKVDPDSSKSPPTEKTIVPKKDN